MTDDCQLPLSCLKFTLQEAATAVRRLRLCQTTHTHTRTHHTAHTHSTCTLDTFFRGHNNNRPQLFFYTTCSQPQVCVSQRRRSTGFSGRCTKVKDESLGRIPRSANRFPSAIITTIKKCPRITATQHSFSDLNGL